MSLGLRAVLDVLASHAWKTGHFEQVLKHEPKNAPGKGLTYALWVDRVAPIHGSGLASASAVVTVTGRIYGNMLAEPQDDIDTNVIGALDVLLTAYCGDFDLGANVRHLDVLGAEGPTLSASTGYLTQDNKLFRVATVALPVIINDVWTESA
jgi:hypothetical protein